MAVLFSGLNAALGTNGFGSLTLSQVWVFILAPLVGGALVALCYNFLSKED